MTVPRPASETLAALWRTAALPHDALDRITLTGGAPVLASSFALGSALQAALGAAALAASEVGHARGGAAHAVSLDVLDVARESAGRFTIDGRAPELWDKVSGLYRTADGHVRVHANFAHHRDGALALLGLQPGPATGRAAVQEALLRCKREDFETAAAERGLVVAALRTPAEWAAHEQAAAVARLPLVDIARIGDAPPCAAWPAGHRDREEHDAIRPLAGLRVLDLTRILAGPVAGRTLAAWGADVLLVNGPHLPNIEAIADTSRGKLSAHVDLRSAAGRATLAALAREADVFVQGYRPGGLAALGFGAEALAALRPGIVCLSLSAYGHAGPWAARRGFDSLVQSATGLNLAEAAAFGSAEPRAWPVQALDYGAGYLLAFGALAALLRRQREGGSWHVRVSLAGVGRWIDGLGRLDRLAGGLQAPPLDFAGAMEESDSGFGRLAAVRHSVCFGGRRAGWARPSMPPGSHAPAWPAR
jgi:crotonobetainyl-CoA:carnitine CoA-transferase CaiB-like acyl-CoA transferase